MSDEYKLTEAELKDARRRWDEINMGDYYSQSPSEPCFCGTYLLRPGSRVTAGPLWSNHGEFLCELRTRPVTATDVEWAEILVARKVDADRRRALLEQQLAERKGP